VKRIASRFLFIASRGKRQFVNTPSVAPMTCHEC
jgi:hypothetical protein